MELRTSFKDLYDPFLPKIGYYNRQPGLQGAPIPFLPWDAPAPQKGYGVLLGSRFMEIIATPSPRGWLSWKSRVRLEEALLIIAGKARPIWLQMGFEQVYGSPTHWIYPPNKTQAGIADTSAWINDTQKDILNYFPNLSIESLKCVEAGKDLEEETLSRTYWNGYWKKMEEFLSEDWSHLNQKFNAPVLILMKKSTLLSGPEMPSSNCNTWVWTNPRLEDLNLNLNWKDVGNEMGDFILNKMPQHRTSLFPGRDLQANKHSPDEMRLDFI